MKILLVCIFIFLILIPFQNAFAFQVILSYYAQDIIFDGKWTTTREWKESGITKYDHLVIRTSHWGDYIYILLDVVADKSFDKFGDRSTICIDSKNEKNKTSDENDYCFVVVPGRSEPITLQGGHFTALTGNFKQITNHPELIGVAGMSDEINRYSKTPHVGYEYKIPIELFERSPNYGFYYSVYDASEKKLFTSTPTDNPLKIPSPMLWDNLVSPDKTLPEFQTPIFLALSIFVLVIFGKFISKKTLGLNLE